MADALGRAAAACRLRLQVNNRKLIEGFYRGLGADRPRPTVMRVVDKLDKLPADAGRARCWSTRPG